MVASTARTVVDYLDSLAPDRRRALAAVRQVILDHLPDGYEETMQYGMLSYVIPLETYPHTYNGQALSYAALASQKNYMSLYLLCVYSDKEQETWFVEAFRAAGKKLDMGKSCVRFKKLDDLPLDVIGATIARTPVNAFIEQYEAVKGRPKASKKPSSVS
jgi:hypothetical protein